MFAKLFLILVSMLISINVFAMDVCIVGAALDIDDGRVSYTTGIGPDGAVPRPTRAMNAKVKATLEAAAKALDPNIQYCLHGKNNDGIFEVSSIDTKKLK